ncbi:MAG: hypothetical protein WBW81_08180 [Methylocella sp.]
MTFLRFSGRRIKRLRAPLVRGDLPEDLVSLDLGEQAEVGGITAAMGERLSYCVRPRHAFAFSGIFKAGRKFTA